MKENLTRSNEVRRKLNTIDQLRFIGTSDSDFECLGTEKIRANCSYTNITKFPLETALSTEFAFKHFVFNNLSSGPPPDGR